MTPITQIESYQKESFSHRMRNGKTATHDVYTQGDHSKVVVLIQELPGIGQETLALADRLRAEKYTVVMPHLFGPIGRTTSAGNFFRVLCMRREFKLFTNNESSPVVDFLAALCMHTKEKHQVKGVAVIGMCLTGNFAISLMANEAVLAGFASQPSMPLHNQRALHMSAEEIEVVKEKLDRVGPMHAGRFEKDWICRAKKMKALNEVFNTEGQTRIVLHELPGEGHGILTLDFVDEAGHPTRQAFDTVVAYFDRQLGHD